MKPTQLTNLLLDQSKDLIWVINPELQLIYANKAYLSTMKEMIGTEKKLNESVLVEGFGEGYIEKWKTYYNRALKGEYFEIEEHYYHPVSKEIQYGQITFKPLTDNDNKFFAVACQSKDITRIVRQKSEASQLIDASLDVFCTIDENGNFVYVSAGALTHWGYTPEEMCGKAYINFILEEDVPKTNEIAASILVGAQVKSFVNRYKKKDGSVAYNLWSARWDNSTKLMYCVARDGKDKIEQEEQIQQSEQRFKALVQEGSDLIGILDTEGNYTYVSPTSASILGIAPEEFIGRNAFEFIHPDDVERTLNSLQKITTQNKVIVEPFRFQNHKNEWRWVETVLTNMLDNPAVNGIVANSRDITAKIEEEHKLKLLESVITNSNDAVLITEAEPLDEPGPRIIYVNEAFTKMTGYTTEEVIGKSPRILQGPNSNKEELAKLSQSLKNWKPHEITTTNYKKNGDEFWINFTVTPIADEKGWYTHWIAIERDVTEQKIKELEKELLAQISLNFSSKHDYVDAIKELCVSISKFGNFDWVELWASNFEKSHIQLLSHHVAAHEDEKFYDYSRDVNSLQIAESLAGKVWSNGAQLLWNDVDSHKGFIRKDAAKKIGLKAVLGIPLVFNNEVIGVLQIGTKHDANYLKNYARIFQKLEKFVGYELNRKKLENDLSHLFDAIPDIICLADFNGRFLRINKAGSFLLGYSEEEILYHSFDEFIHPEDKDIATNEMQHLKNGETSFAFENRYITKQGNIIWLSWYCNSSMEEGLIYATAKNITEEKKLRELNRQVSSLAKIGSWQVDLVNQNLYWSDEVHQLHETNPKLFVPNLEGAINFYREDFRQMVESSIKKSITTGEPFDYEAILVTAKKKERWVRAIGNAEFVDGECKRIYGSFQNIHDRKHTEEKLVDSEQKYRQLALKLQLQQLHLTNAQEVAKVGSWETELPSLKVTWSDETYRIFGTDRESFEPTHEKFLEYVHPLDRDKVDKAFTDSIFDSIQSNNIIEHRIVTTSGEIKAIEERWKITYNNKGEALLVIGSCQDITERKKAEILLQESENKFRSLIENSSDMLTLITADGRMEYISPSVEKTFGYTNEENKTRQAMEVIHPDDVPEAIKVLENAFKNPGVPFASTVRNRKKDGTYIWVEGTVTNMLHVPGVNAIAANIHDITERKKAEELILKANERFEKVTEATNDAIWDWDMVKQTFYRSNAFERFFGKKVQKSFKETDFWKDNFHPEDLPKIQDSIQELIANPSINRWELEYRVFNEHREVLYVIDRGVVVRNNDGKALRIIGAMTDISEQKKSNEENRFKANLLSRIGQAAIATNLDGVINYWNKAAETIYGWAEEEAIGKNIVHLTTPYANMEQAMQIMERLKKGQTWSGEFKVMKKDGTNFPALINNSPIYDENKILSGIIGISSDISLEVKNKELLKQYTLELERSNEELEQFAFVASHDLQEPLRMISSFMDLLQRKYGEQLDEKGHQYIHFAMDGAKRMKQIILDLLEYSRAGKSTEGKVDVDLNEVLSEFKQLRRKIISEKTAVIIAITLPTLNTYKAAITQILHCLLDNALRYSAQDIPPIVEMNALETENEWEFSIKDNGIGIDSQFYDKIFIVFQRLHNKNEYAGTGIGLSIAKRQIEFLGGRIWLDSKPGEGTTFYFTISKTK